MSDDAVITSKALRKKDKNIIIINIKINYVYFSLLMVKGESVFFPLWDLKLLIIFSEVILILILESLLSK